MGEDPAAHIAATAGRSVLASAFDLAGKVAVVTGSSRGIGRASAEAMAALGARLVISSRKAEACEAVARQIRASTGEAAVIPCNISRKPEVEALVAETLRIFGRIDILVCNAAINPVYGPLGELTDEAFDKVMGANVKSNLWLCNLVIPGMAERGGGAVVIVSSIAGLRGTAMIGAYGMSKAADFALARNLAVEWGPRNVRVNCVAPGLVKTDFARALWENPEHLAKRTAATPLRRIGTPEEIGSVVAFLASPAASFITGQVIVADGGVTIA
jgi:NAD(P)-dependent dehydrogenase (short-subunit alcohol dehydrogenase family)